MPVHKYKPTSGPLAGQSHVIARAPLTNRDFTWLHKYREERTLSLDRIKTDSLDFIADWTNLRDLRMYSCKIGDCSPLARLKRLTKLFINGVRHKAADLSFLSGLEQLEDLGIGGAPRLLAIPDLSRCSRLKRLNIFGCKRLIDLSAVLQVKSLESFGFCAGQLEPTDLEAIMAMPKMKFMSGAFGRAKKNAQFAELMKKHGLVYG